MTANPVDPFGWPWPWTGSWNGRIAPDRLSQDILTGWSLVSINQTNSSAPDTERRIVAQESYGRQIGRLMDAVCALVAERPEGSPPDDAFVALAALRARVEAAKRDAAADRLARIREDLALLKASDTPEDREAVAALRALLGG